MTRRTLTTPDAMVRLVRFAAEDHMPATYDWTDYPECLDHVHNRLRAVGVPLSRFEWAEYADSVEHLRHITEEGSAGLRDAANATGQAAEHVERYCTDTIEYTHALIAQRVTARREAAPLLSDGVGRALLSERYGDLNVVRREQKPPRPV